MEDGTFLDLNTAEITRGEQSDNATTVFPCFPCLSLLSLSLENKVEIEIDLSLQDFGLTKKKKPVSEELSFG